jgi:hypothetical protein
MTLEQIKPNRQVAEMLELFHIGTAELVIQRYQQELH